MRVADFDYELSPDRIAQHPAERRETARLLVIGAKAAEDHTIAELPDLVPEGALVVVNDTRVLPARLLGTKRGTGGRAEIFLLRKTASAPDGETWTALGKASKGMRRGTLIDVGQLEVVVLEQGPPATSPGMLVVALRTGDGSSVAEAIRKVGRVPLPPYIRREAQAAGSDEADRERYQTMFARVEGAVAAPTAGLHLTEALVDRMVARRCTIAPVTLHVGLGTFQPVTVDDLDQHPMHAEWFEVPPETARAIDAARERGAPVLGIGTTTVRALESAPEAPGGGGRILASAGETRLLIQPGYRFRVVNLLLTNFHLPRSTLLALVCAFGGTERILRAYRQAHEARYRFFSYGDAMLVSPAT